MAQGVRETIQVRAPAEDVFRYWPDFENSAGRKPLAGEGPPDRSVKFDAETTEMDPGIGQNTVDDGGS